MKKAALIFYILLFFTCALLAQKSNSNSAIQTKKTQTSEIGAIEMVTVQGGTFQMGSNDETPGEKPVHSVTVSSFMMSKTEITQAQWMSIMGSNPSEHKNCDDCPVEQVSWTAVQDFLNKLNEKTSKHYRLPTEAEWEYAALGGIKNKGYKFCGSDNLNDVAWNAENSGGISHQVAKKKPNSLGLYDMSGNVWEWCSDWYGSYSGNPQTDPKGPETGTDHVIRGGRWSGDAANCTASFRFHYAPENRNFGLGFRVVLSL
jgi:formylglycine-generating enzyme required for sulfatase activity